MSLYTMQVEELAELLQSTGILLRLRELRLINESPTAAVFDIVSNALSDNKMIKLVELCTAFYPEMQDRIDDKHRHDRVEMTTLPLAHRLAFISVFSSDRWILERVFEFTGMAVQRTLLWTIKWQPPYFDKF